MLRLDATDPWIRWDWLGHHTDVIWQALVQHIQLTGIAVLGGLAIATPVGLLVWRWRALRNPVLSVAGILYTIPSLALFALLVPFTGLTVVTAEIAVLPLALGLPVVALVFTTLNAAVLALRIRAENNALAAFRETITRGA